MNIETLKSRIADCVAFAGDLRVLLAFPVSAEGIVGEPIDASKGAALGAETKPGAVLARLVGIPMEPGARWALVGLQPEGEIETAVAAGHRILAAANLIAFQLAGVYVATPSETREITFPETFPFRVRCSDGATGELEWEGPAEDLLAANGENEGDVTSILEALRELAAGAESALCGFSRFVRVEA